MNYEIKEVSANGQLQVRFWNNDNPDGVIYSVDVPLTEEGAFLSGSALEAHIMKFAPHDYFSLLVRVRAADIAPLRALVPPTAKTPEQLAEEARNEAKKNRAEYVAGIKVTTQSGRTFDGDETSQNRMTRAIIGLNAQPQDPVPTITWVLADNTPVQVTAAELTEALALAGAAQAAVWVV